ncbi:MAG: ATP-binding protein, partial [Thermomicrobiales bacterium]
MTPRLADRLLAARHRRFVGRAAELGLFDTALAASELPFSVLHVDGPGGVGKTTLLNTVAAACERRGVAVARLDGRDIDSVPDAFLGALAGSLGVAAGDALDRALLAPAARRVILVDTYEMLTPLDGWLRETWLPQLPETVLVVLAGRQPP